MVDGRQRKPGPLELAVVNALQRSGRSVSWLEDRLRANGVNLKVTAMDGYANPDDVKLVAGIMGIPASELLKADPRFSEALLRAIFDEEVLRLRDLPLSTEEAWRKVAQSVEFKGRGLDSIREEVALTLNGLNPPSAKQTLRWLDCECGARCSISGRLRDSGQ